MGEIKCGIPGNFLGLNFSIVSSGFILNLLTTVLLTKKKMDGHCQTVETGRVHD